MRPNELLSVAEAAALVGCHRSTIDYAIRRGELACVTLPPAARRQGVKRWLAYSDVLRYAAVFTGKPGPRPRERA